MSEELAMSEVLRIPYQRFASLEQLPEADRELVAAAFEAAKRAYAPYSEFRVGAAARLRSGRVIVAANCESEVFPSGMCAERSLLYHYASNFASDPIEAMAIASDPSSRECYPCGACRQVIVDTEQRQQSPIRLVMAGGGTATVLERSQWLLPFTFKL